ncbi:MAG: cupin domain-containing protein [Myxococcota bacterium]
MRLLVPGLLLLSCATPGAGLAPIHLTLSPEPVEQPLLKPPKTAGLRSGRVVLAPHADMHRHSTKSNEEVLVMLQGTVRVVLGAEPMTLSAGEVLYIPPMVEHEVHNDTDAEARYLYLVAPAR